MNEIFFRNTMNHKLDMCEDIDPNVENTLKNIGINIHEKFKNHVLLHRGKQIEKYSTPKEKIFNADVFMGKNAVELG